MTEFRFVHAADLHLDSPFTGIQSVAPPNVHARLIEATFAAYDRTIDLCLAERVDALLVAGDIYDGADRSLKAQLRFVQGLERLDRAGIRSFVCHGNHDPLDGWQARLRFPPSCHQFGRDVAAVPLDPARPGLATVYGVSYAERDVRDNLVPQFGTGPRDGFSIGLLHCNVGNNPEHAAYSPCTVDDLRQTGIDYWALGHVHTRQVVNGRGPAVVYPGNPQGRHPLETGERGVYLVEVRADSNVNLSFHDVSVVRWESLTIDATGMVSEQELVDAADGLIADARASAEGRDLICRLTVAGRGELHERLERPNACEDLREVLNSRWTATSPFAWCERLENRVRREIDRESLRRQEDFSGDVVRLIDRAHSDPELQAALRRPLSDLLEHKRAGRLIDGERIAVGDLMADVEALCLEELL
ncbi:MAG: phosphoesterase [Anaerolinea sp.]|nr:phosphoesterase [Anaerolinea sp.]